MYCEYVPKDIDRLKNKKLIAFAGIGNPNNFFDFLKKNDLDVIKEIKYPDHYDYSEKSLNYLIQLKNKYEAILVTTEKDYMRIGSDHRQNFDYIAIETDLKNPDLLNNFLRKKIL